MRLAFLDTNILIHLTNSDQQFVATSRRLVEDGPVVSVQILNEAVNVLRGKIKLDWPDVYIFMAAIRSNCIVVPLTAETHDRALTYAERHRLSWYDATIVAAAALAGCSVLYTEDMHSGFVIDGVTIRNPYAR